MTSRRPVILPDNALLDDTARSSPASASDTVCDRIRARIVSGELPLGGRIHDKQLALEMGTSRTPVREALLHLQNEGLVVIRPQSGTFVFSLTKADLHHLCVTRAVIETGAIRFGLADGAPDTLARLGALVGRAAVALEDGNLGLCDELDRQFHESLVASTGNRYLVRVYSGISAQLRALRHHLPANRARVGRAIEQHRRILDLCAAGRTGDAIDQLTDHVNTVEYLLTQVGGVIAGAGR
jgi:DNA-binding GntR family transcriptional regulator